MKMYCFMLFALASVLAFGTPALGADARRWIPPLNKGGQGGVRNASEHSASEEPPSVPPWQGGKKGTEQGVAADGPAGQPTDAASHPSRFESGQILRKTVAIVSPSVVTIETVGGTQPVSPTSGPARPAGFILADGPTTGLVYSSDGLILTSTFNFLRNPTVITVVLADGRRLVAELLARDELHKLAMLKVPARDLPVPSWRPEGESPVVVEIIGVAIFDAAGIETME